MEPSAIFKFTALIRAKIDRSYDEMRVLISQLHEDDYREMLNDANRFLSQARQKMYDFDRYVEKKTGTADTDTLHS